MPNKLTKIAREILTIENDFLYRVNNPDSCKIIDDSFKLFMFEQSWGSTALGFDEVGGRTMTSAMTYVFVPQIEGEDCIVYFAGRFAYKAPYNRTFMADVAKRRMEPVCKSIKYIEDAYENG